MSHTLDNSEGKWVGKTPDNETTLHDVKPAYMGFGTYSEGEIWIFLIPIYCIPLQKDRVFSTIFKGSIDPKGVGINMLATKGQFTTFRFFKGLVPVLMRDRGAIITWFLQFHLRRWISISPAFIPRLQLSFLPVLRRFPHYQFHTLLPLRIRYLPTQQQCASPTVFPSLTPCDLIQHPHSNQSQIKSVPSPRPAHHWYRTLLWKWQGGIANCCGSAPVG